MAQSSDLLLSMRHIRKAFFGVTVLNDVDFDLKSGEVHVLLGENGAGKSTLIKILSGAYKLDSGEMSLAGRSINCAGHTPKVAESLGVVTIYQTFHLVPHLSVAENLALVSYPRKAGFIRWRDVRISAQEVLDRMNFDISVKAKVRDLSVSKKQMLEIAIALSKNAKILIMDEPTAALSRHEVDILFRTMKDITTRGIGIIYISHKLEEIKQIGDRVTVLRDGKNVATVDPRAVDQNEIVELMIGKELAGTRRSEGAKRSGRILEARSIQSRSLPIPLSFELHKNEILGVTGLVGAGKTELARALFGDDHLTNGEIVFSDEPVRIRSPRHAVRRGIGYLPEDRDSDGLCLNMGVKENLSLALFAKERQFAFTPKFEKQLVRRLVEDVHIRAASLSQQVKYLSGGNKQKVVMGKWLRAGCTVLVLDEPTIGIDVGARAEIYALIREFVSAGDQAVLFLTSDMNEAIEVSDRLLVMARFQIVAELDPAKTSKQEIMQYSLRIREDKEGEPRQ